MCDKKRYILTPLTERRKKDRHHIETIVEIFPELLFRDRFFKITIRSGDHADIDTYRLSPAHAFKLALLKRTQQLHLHGRRNVPDLI